MPDFTSRIKREDGKVILKDVEFWGSDRFVSSVQAAQYAILKYLGEDITYNELVGASALAFRTQMHNKFCPSSPHPFCGEQCGEGALKILPWKTKHYQLNAEDEKQKSEVRAAVKESIDKGIPVQFGSEEDGLIIGYYEDGKRWLAVHPFKNNGQKVFPVRKWPWAVDIYTARKKDQPDKRAAALESLKRAVAMSELKQKGDYYTGFNAWEKWISMLEDLQGKEEKEKHPAMQGNFWTYCSLADYRTAAAEYLCIISGEFCPEASSHLEKAAHCYSHMVKKVLLDGDCPTDIAQAPWKYRGRPWKDETRNEQIRRLKKAYEIEKQAIAEIKKALEIIE